MADQAKTAEVPYLKNLKLPKGEFEAIMNDMTKMKPGKEGYPEFLEYDPFFLIGRLSGATGAAISMVLAQSENVLRATVGNFNGPDAKGVQDNYTAGEKRFAQQLTMRKDRDFGDLSYLVETNVNILPSTDPEIRGPKEMKLQA